MQKSKFKILICLVLSIVIFAMGIIPAFAHPQMLDVVYDNCDGADDTDGIDEMWYILYWSSINNYIHISHETTTIKYYFEEKAEATDSTYTWTTDISEEVANEIKDAFANSMKKWNNVYFYSYDSSGNIVKNKIINIVEGTKDDHNLSIYPKDGTNYYATCGPKGSSELVESDTVTHRHYSDWAITVYVDHFVYNETNNAEVVSLIRERTGAHEFGHVLGLFDIDNDEHYHSENDVDNHHEELLMGYGSIPGRSSDIKYKDIAGVAINRGFHTDNDHMWLNMGYQTDGMYKLVCSICNGVKYVNSLNGYDTNTYGLCDGEHDIQGGNMMAVASYGTKDYYKCKYCNWCIKGSTPKLKLFIF